MLALIIDGLSIAHNYWKEILTLLLSGLGFGGVCAAILYRRERADEGIMFVLLSGFVLIGLLAPLLALMDLLNRFSVMSFIGSGMASVVYLIRKGVFSHWRKSEFERNLWIPICSFVFFLIIRLAFIKPLSLPPFSDSAEHFKRIAALLVLRDAQPIGIQDFLPYYHWGFHAITAWVGTATGYTHPLLMAVIAHVFLALLPVSVYFMMLRAGNGQILPALLGSALAGMGWIMPAYAINYGKYPALISICTAPLFLGILTAGEDVFQRKRWDWLIFLVVCVAGISWIHSRMGIFLVIYLAAHFASHFISRKLSQKTAEVAAFAALAGFAVFMLLSGDGIQGRILFNLYLGEYGVSTFLVFVIAPFAIPKHTRQVLQWCLILFLLIIGTQADLPDRVYHYPLNMFDQLFFDLILFLPLVVLGTLGASGMGSSFIAKGQYSQPIPIFLMILIFVNGWIIQPWTPSAEANYVSADDLRVYSWIEDESAPDAQFVTASLVKNERYSRASDSGAWITILTGRSVIKASHELEWDDPLALEGLCTQAGSASSLYVYVGHTATSFDLPFCAEGLHLTPTLCYPDAKLFLLDCQPFYK